MQKNKDYDQTAQMHRQTRVFPFSPTYTIKCANLPRCMGELASVLMVLQGPNLRLKVRQKRRKTTVVLENVFVLPTNPRLSWRRSGISRFHGAVHVVFIYLFICVCVCVCVCVCGKIR